MRMRRRSLLRYHTQNELGPLQRVAHMHPCCRATRRNWLVSTQVPPNGMCSKMISLKSAQFLIKRYLLLTTLNHLHSRAAIGTSRCRATHNITLCAHRTTHDITLLTFLSGSSRNRLATHEGHWMQHVAMRVPTHRKI